MSGGGGSSNESYVQEQYDYDVKKWQYDKQEMEDAYSYAMETHQINMQNVMNAQSRITFIIARSPNCIRILEIHSISVFIL